MRRATFWPRTFPWRLPARCYAMNVGLHSPDFQSTGGGRRDRRTRASPGGGDGELAASRREVVLHLERLPRFAPAEFLAEDLGDARRNRRATVGQLLGKPRSARQDVVERSGPAPGGRPRRPRPRGTCGPPTSGRSRSSSAPSATTAGASVPCRATSWAATASPHGAHRGNGRQLGSDPGLGACVRRTDQPPVGGLAPPSSAPPRVPGRHRPHRVP